MLPSSAGTISPDAERARHEILGESMSREPKQIVGCSKSGLRVSLTEQRGQLILRGQADPLLLYLAIGAALGLGLLASITRSPAQGFVSSFVFSALFSPILLFLIYSTFRLRTRCVISKPEGAIFISERSFNGRTAFTIPLSDVSGIIVSARSQLPIVGGPETYSLYFDTPELRYLVLAGYDEAGVQRIADRLSEVLRLPIKSLGFDDLFGSVRVSGRVLAATAVLYLVPPLAAIVALYVAFRESPLPDLLMISSLGAIVLSQLGAILAFAYYRAHEPRG